MSSDDQDKLVTSEEMGRDINRTTMDVRSTIVTTSDSNNQDVTTQDTIVDQDVVVDNDTSIEK